MRKSLRKILVAGVVALVACCAVGAFSGRAAYAEGESSTQTDGRCGSLFLGMIPWDCGVSIDEVNSTDKLTSSILTIIANIAHDLAILAAYLVLGYVIYGGYLYLLANGDVGKVVTGKRTIVHAFIGLAIVMSVNLIMGFIRAALGGANLNQNCVGQQCVDPGIIITDTIQQVVGIAGVVAVIFVVIGGIAYMTSAGDANKLQKAKSTIVYALVGLLIVALAEILTGFVSKIIRDANNQTAWIEKEYYETTQIS